MPNKWKINNSSYIQLGIKVLCLCATLKTGESEQADTPCHTYWKQKLRSRSPQLEPIAVGRLNYLMYCWVDSKSSKLSDGVFSVCCEPTLSKFLLSVALSGSNCENLREKKIPHAFSGGRGGGGGGNYHFEIFPEPPVSTRSDPM